MSDNHLGLRVYASAALPATNNAAGFEALTWTEIKSPVNGFTLATSQAMSDIADITTGFSRGKKGMASGVESTAAFNEVAADTGQALALTTAHGKTGICSIRQVQCTGTDSGAGPIPATGDTTEYAQGVLNNYVPNQATSESTPGFSVTFRQNALTIIDEYPA